MEEEFKEKYYMENKYPQVIKNNIFKKIIKYFKRLFEKDEIETIEIEPKEKNNDRNDFISNLKISNEENDKIFKILKQYENNEITLESLSDEELEKLNILYEKQLIELNKKLEDRTNELNMLEKEYSEAFKKDI